MSSALRVDIETQAYTNNESYCEPAKAAGDWFVNWISRHCIFFLIEVSAFIILPSIWIHRLTKETNTKKKKKCISLVLTLSQARVINSKSRQKCYITQYEELAFHN